MWKDFFYYSRNEQKGIVVLLILIAIVVIVRVSLPFVLLNQELSEGQIAFLDKVNTINQTSVMANRSQDSLFVFNPNSVSEDEMRKLGFSSYQLKSLIGYRNKIGHISTFNDLKKVYGVDSTFILKYADYIQFDKTNQLIKKDIDHKVIRWINFNKVEAHFWDDIVQSSKIRDSIKHLLQIKFITKQLPFNTVRDFDDHRMLLWLDKNSKLKTKNRILDLSIELNSTDTIELKKIKGIGSVISKRILKYRDLLGGYVEVDQLREVYGISDTLYSEIKNQFVVDLSTVKRIDLSKDKISEICRHPYYNYKQTIELKNILRKGVDFDTLSVLDSKNITKEDWCKMKKYLK